MMSRSWKSRQLNRRVNKASNAGFSLVELLIAVTILAIIVIPLLHMFVTSTRINVKSRQMLRATTVAQDIMEGLKAYTLEEVRTQFTPPDGVSGSSYFFPSEGFYVVNTNLIQGGVREIEELEIDDPDDPDKEIYYFGIENLKMQGGEYDALIRLDASTYTEAKVNPPGGPTADAHDNIYNGAFYAEIGSVSEVNGGGDESDSSYHEHKKLNEAVLRDIKKQIEEYYANLGADLPDDPDSWDALTLEDIITNRNIDVVIEDAGSNDGEGNPQCKVAITFKYTCRYHGNDYTSYGDVGSEAGEVKDNVFRTFSSGNFYLFYYPIYKTGTVVDRIQFTIKDGAKLFDADQPMLKSITLAKQIRSTVDTEHSIIAPDMTETELYNAENGYSASVDITIDGTMSSKLVFKSNLDSNLGKNPATGKRGEEMVTSGVVLGGGFTNPNISQVALSGDNVSDKVTNVIYDIEITVYKNGAAQYFKDPNFESNPEVQRLATITNLD